jgi:hypothetical protein
MPAAPPHPAAQRPPIGERCAAGGAVPDVRASPNRRRSLVGRGAGRVARGRGATLERVARHPRRDCPPDPRPPDPDSPRGPSSPWPASPRRRLAALSTDVPPARLCPRSRMPILASGQSARQQAWHQPGIHAGAEHAGTFLLRRLSRRWFAEENGGADARRADMVAARRAPGSRTVRAPNVWMHGVAGARWPARTRAEERTPHEARGTRTFVNEHGPRPDAARGGRSHRDATGRSRRTYSTSRRTRGHDPARG